MPPEYVKSNISTFIEHKIWKTYDALGSVFASLVWNSSGPKWLKDSVESILPKGPYPNISSLSIIHEQDL